MNISSNKKVSDFLLDIESLSPDKFEIVSTLRSLFLKANDTVEEDIKYGGVVFSIAGDLRGGIYVYKEHVSLEFSNGAEFTDAKGLLMGKGKKRRHIKLTTKDDIKTNECEVFIGLSL